MLQILRERGTDTLWGRSERERNVRYVTDLERERDRHLVGEV